LEIKNKGGFQVVPNIIDDDVEYLRKKMKELKHRIERAQAVNACENLMNKYQFYHMRAMRTEETHLFALKSPGACVEMLWGIYDEPEGVLRWKRSEGYGKPRMKGAFPMHSMSTPIIEVAKNGQTAKGLWYMFGAESGKMPGQKEADANWATGQFAMDFIKEDGEWKIWKYNTTGLIFSPFEKGWMEQNGIPEMLSENNTKRPAEYAADRPPSYAWMAKPGEYWENIPPVPLPYETWDDSLACIPVPGSHWNFKHKK
jgi:hypothetical protein